MGVLTARGAGRIVNNMTDAEVIELIREIKRLKDYVKKLTNQNEKLQQELEKLDKQINF